MLVNLDDWRWDDLLWMPTTRALLQAGGVEFTRHIDDIAACAPGRATLLTGLYAHSHGISATNANPEHWNWWRSPTGTSRQVGRTDATAGSMTATVGPAESIVAGREDLTGCLFNWLKLAGVTTGVVGKLENQSHAPDLASNPSLTTAQAEHTRVPPDIDFYAGACGSVATNVSNSTAAFYKLAGDATACCTQNADGSVTIQLVNSANSVTLPDVGDLLVVQGTATAAFNQVYDVGSVADYAAAGVTGSAKVFLAWPRTATGLATGTTVGGGNVTSWKFTGGQHAPRHSMMCVKKTPTPGHAAGVGTLRFHSVDDGVANASGLDPLNAAIQYESDVFSDYLIEFIGSRGPQESWFLYVAPQVPHYGYRPMEVSPKYRVNLVMACTSGSNLVTVSAAPYAGFDMSSLVGWQIVGQASTTGALGNVDSRVRSNCLVGAVSGSGPWTLTLVEEDGSASNCKVTGSSTVELDKVPYRGFASWHNIAGQVAPTIFDQAITGDIVISGGVATVPCVGHGFVNEGATYLANTGVIDGYYARVTKISNDAFTVPTSHANGTFTLASMGTNPTAIDRSRLADWSERQAKLISIDEMMARTITMLTQRGWLDQTVIMLTGDNGLTQGEHGAEEGIGNVWGNSKGFLWHAASRTGMFVKAPNWPAGHSISRPTWHADIPLGILDWFGLDDVACTAILGFNPHVQRDGVSLKRIFENPSGSSPDRAIYMNGDFLGQFSGDALVASDGRKVMRTSDLAVSRMYDSLGDEGEVTDLASANATLLASMLSRMVTLSTRRGASARST